MKTTSFAIIFVLIFFPLFQISAMRLDHLDQNTRLINRYDVIMKTAVQDAAYVMNDTVEQDYEPGYGSKKFFRANKERAVETFYRTLSLNFGINGDEVAIGNMAGYIPAILTIDYDGFYVYATESFTATNGESKLKPVWSSKKPYSYADDQGNIIQFSLDGYVKVFNKATNRWVQGQRHEIESQTQVPLLKDAALFETVRRQTIIDTIQRDLAFVINRHNTYTTRYGVDYVFTLPAISDEEWDNGIDDIGIVAFVQGIPVGDQAYNNFAFGGGRLQKKKTLYAATDSRTGIKYYDRDASKLPGRVEERFESEKDAAMYGYFPIRR